MSKRVLVAVDPSPENASAQRAAFMRAQLFGGTVRGVAVVDTPGIERNAAGGGVGAAHLAHQTEQMHLQHARQKANAALDQFEALAASMGVSYERVLREGSPVECITEESFSVDVVVIGTRTFFHFETKEEPGDTLKKLLHAKLCPVLAIPHPFTPPKRIIFAYDGSPPAARTMRMFNYLTRELAQIEEVLLVGIGDDRDALTETLRAPTTYLSAYGFKVRPLIEAAPAQETIPKIARANMPAVVALGASSRGAIERLFMGSVTQTFIDDGTIPLFVAS